LSSVTTTTIVQVTRVAAAPLVRSTIVIWSMGTLEKKGDAAVKGERNTNEKIARQL